jgi:biopolymer transport protein ExbB/TolQ
MHFDLVKIFQEMDLMARLVTFALLAMGVASLAVFIERAIAYARSRAQSRAFAKTASALIAERRYGELGEVGAKFPASHLARAVVPALKLYSDYRKHGRRGPEVVEAVRRELMRQHEQATTDLRRGLSVLASVGSVAPFVGLLGTVAGIIAAFSKISSTGSGGLASVAGGISEALVVTALGLLIAIPAVLVFNTLSNRAERIVQGLTVSIGELIDHIELGTPQHPPHVIATEHLDGNRSQQPGLTTA